MGFPANPPAMLFHEFLGLNEHAARPQETLLLQGSVRSCPNCRKRCLNWLVRAINPTMAKLSIRATSPTLIPKISDNFTAAVQLSKSSETTKPLPIHRADGRRSAQVSRRPGRSV